MAQEKRLTDKQEVFCREYIESLNATKSAIAAGYSKKTAQVIGSENLSKPIIQERLQVLMRSRFKDIEISGEAAVATMGAMAFTDLGEIITWDDEGYAHVKPSDQLNKRQSAAIKKVKFDTHYDKECERHTKVEIELHDKLKATQIIGQHFGKFQTKVSINPDELPDIVISVEGG